MMPERVQIRGWLKSYPDRPTRSRPKPLCSALTGPAPTLSWEEIRKLSGPRFPEIDAAIRAARAAGGSTVGAVIEHLPHDTRRPVDLLGIIHRGVLASAAERETVRTVRGDGSVVHYSIPLISIVAEETHHA